MKKVEGRPQLLGAVLEYGRMNFAVSVPEGKTCELLLYKDSQKDSVQVYDMPEEDALGEVRFLAFEECEAKQYEYNFRVDGKVYVDPFAKELSRTKTFGVMPDAQMHEIRGRVTECGYDWEGDRPLKIPYHEVIAYSLHVRGFTKHSSSKVKHKGTFAGVVEKIPYLKELGINQIQCMPVYEFDEIVDCYQNYWGYGKGYYFAPKAAYSVMGQPSVELKDMVKACHKAGIEVVLEMPFTSDVLPQTATDCLKHYMLEYHIDGFVVNPYNVPWDSLNKDPLLKGVKIMRKDDRFQNTMRRFLKGDEGMVNDVIRALRHHTKEDGKCNYITGQTGFTLNDLVSYDAKHNEANGENNTDGPDYNYSWNCGAEGPSRKKAVAELRKKQVKNAFLLLLLAQGTPCILAGDEFGNTQKGNNNVYCQDNETAWLDWSRLKKDDSLFRYVKDVIGLRKSHPVFHRAEPLLGLDKTSCGVPDVSYHGESAWQIPSEISSRQLGVLYSEDGTGDTECYIAYNMHWLEHDFAVPSLLKKKKWYRIFDTSDNEGVKEELEDNQKIIELKERTIAVLIGK